MALKFEFLVFCCEQGLHGNLAGLHLAAVGAQDLLQENWARLPHTTYYPRKKFVTYFFVEKPCSVLSKF